MRYYTLTTKSPDKVQPFGAPLTASHVLTALDKGARLPAEVGDEVEAARGDRLFVIRRVG